LGSEWVGRGTIGFRVDGEKKKPLGSEGVKRDHCVPSGEAGPLGSEWGGEEEGPSGSECVERRNHCVPSGWRGWTIMFRVGWKRGGDIGFRVGGEEDPLCYEWIERGIIGVTSGVMGTGV
jgi:hypothetical protein